MIQSTLTDSKRRELVMPSKTVMLVAGEASGDLHATNLVLSLKKLNPDIRFVGMGGNKMRSAGVDLLVDSSTLAVVGLVEVLAHYPQLRSALTKLQTSVQTLLPDLLILVDYPEFNLKLATSAKKVGVKVMYYISPQVWAWRPGRVKKIRRVVDMMAVVFPFEVAIYQAAKVPVKFTGHPLVDEVKAKMSDKQARTHFGLDPKRKVVGLFPGSRKSEIKRLLSVVLDSAQMLLRRFPDLQFILPLAPGLNAHEINQRAKDRSIPLLLVENEVYDVIRSCDAIITASGTVTLQIALLETPMVIIYRLAPLSYWIGRLLVTVRQIGLVNIVLEKPVVREFIQHAATPENISNEISRLLTEKEYACEMRQALAEVRQRLGKGGGSDRAASLVNELLE